MKRLLSYLIVASFLVACGKKVEIIEPPFVFDDNLLQIDSMMQHDADSALIMLTSFRPTEGSGEISSKFNANYQSLLLSEAFYKTYNPQLNRYCSETFQETSLQDAMRYFDSLNVLNAGIWDIATEVNNNNQWRRIPARDIAISVTDDAIFHCGVMGISSHSHNPSVSNIAPSTITLSKFDKELNLQWRRYYGGDGSFYDVNVIKATEDGGCIMTGVYNKDMQVYDLLSYVLKVDENGYDAIGENAESIARPYFCYPNPAKDNVYIEFSPDVNCQSVEIYTLDGHMVETCHGASLQTTIDISSLNSGVYMLKLRMSDGKEWSERIVKE